MSFVPKTDDATLWALLGTLVATLAGLEWWSRRERAPSNTHALEDCGADASDVAAENGEESR